MPHPAIDHIPPVEHLGHRMHTVNAAGASWWVLDQLQRHGPRWELVPPLLLATASLIAAMRGWKDAAAAARRADERHRLELDQLRRPYPPVMESPN